MNTYKRSTAHRNNVIAETARRLDMDIAKVVNMPIIELAKIMADKGVTFGVQEAK